jgi:hypothetical protein
MSDEEVLGPAPQAPTGYINIPREVQAQYQQAVTQRGMRGRDLQRGRDDYRKEIEATARRTSERAEDRAQQEARDKRIETARMAREEFSQTRQDRRAGRTDARIERMSKEARGETARRDVWRDYQRDKREARLGYDKFVAGLKKSYVTDEAEFTKAKAEYDQELLEIEKDYAGELRQQGGGTPGAPKGKARYNPATKTIEYQ